MKIVVVCRTRNEELHVDRFVQSYEWADKILIADGGSNDRTLDLLALYAPLVEVRPFTDRVSRVEGTWRNPHGKHLNFLAQWAKEEGYDWVLFEDMDRAPNLAMRNQIRSVLNTSKADSVWMKQMFMWGTNQWFPQLTPNTPEFFGIWGFRKGVEVVYDETDPWKTEFTWTPHETRELIDFPAALLHYFCLTPEIARAKQQFYVAVGEYKSVNWWPDVCGPIVPLPIWAAL